MKILKTNKGLFLEVCEQSTNIVNMKYTLKNLDKVRKKNMGFWGWQKLPDNIKHYSKTKDGKWYKIPIGFESFVDKGYIENRQDKMLIDTTFEFREGLSLYDQQEESVSKLLERNVGLLHASTGAGKTFMIAKIIEKKQCKTLVVTNNTTLLTQMCSDINEILGVNPRYVYGKKPTKKDEKTFCEDIHVGCIDTLVKKDEVYLSQFDLIIFDEADSYLGADKRREWVASLSPVYMYALTGTLKINYKPDALMPMYFGKITKHELFNFIPDVYKVITEFEYSEGELMDMKDFHQLQREVFEDTERNNLIVDTVQETLKGRKGIVFVFQIEHAKLLRDMFENIGIKTFMIIGEVSNADRERIRKEIQEYKGECVLVGSVKCIGRGFNCPELSVGYLTTPEKFDSNITQYVGRVIRKADDKTGADFYDFCDINVGILSNQAKTRERNYKRTYDGVKIYYY